MLPQVIRRPAEEALLFARAADVSDDVKDAYQEYRQPPQHTPFGQNSRREKQYQTVLEVPRQCLRHSP